MKKYIIELKEDLQFLKGNWRNPVCKTPIQIFKRIGKNIEEIETFLEEHNLI